MPITFRGTIKGYRTDDEGEGTLTFRVPSSDQDQANNVSKKTKRTLFITVFEQDEIGQGEG